MYMKFGKLQPTWSTQRCKLKIVNMGSENYDLE